MQGNLTAQFSADAPVKLRSDLSVDGQARMAFAVDSLADGIINARGALSLDGLNCTTSKVSLEGLTGWCRFLKRRGDAAIEIFIRRFR